MHLFEGLISELLSGANVELCFVMPAVIRIIQGFDHNLKTTLLYVVYNKLECSIILV